MAGLLENFIRTYDFEKLNTITKYPNILPLHQVNDAGAATNTLSTAEYQPVPIQTNKMEVEVSELIDGELSRIIILGDDFLIGDKKEIVHAKGDRIITNDIVMPTYNGLNNFIREYRPSEERFLILYGIVYGASLNGSNRYTNIGKSSYALIEGFTAKVADMQTLCTTNSIDELQVWNNTLQAPFWTISTKNKFANAFNLAIAPKLTTLTLDKVPINPNKMLDWLWEFTDSKIVLDTEEEQEQFYSSQDTSKTNNNEPPIDPLPNPKSLKNAKGEDDFLSSLQNNHNKEELPTKAKNKFKNRKSNLGKSKGVIIKNNDRSYIRQIRFEDYIKMKKK